MCPGMKASINGWRVGAITLVAIGVLVLVGWQRGVFDDEPAGLRQEPFVAGIPEMIDAMVRDIPDAGNGFRLLFSARPFPGYTEKLVWLRGDSSGNGYYSESQKKEGWLCPALFAYYPKAPREIYAKAEQK